MFWVPAHWLMAQLWEAVQLEEVGSNWRRWILRGMSLKIMDAPCSSSAFCLLTHHDANPLCHTVLLPCSTMPPLLWWTETMSQNTSFSPLNASVECSVTEAHSNGLWIFVQRLQVSFQDCVGPLPSSVEERDHGIGVCCSFLKQWPFGVGYWSLDVWTRELTCTHGGCLTA